MDGRPEGTPGSCNREAPAGQGVGLFAEGGQFGGVRGWEHDSDRGQWPERERPKIGKGG